MFLNLCNVVLLAVILTGTGLGLIGCGGSSAAVTPTQPTSKTSTVTVIATTATGLSQSNAITLIVN
jgi:ABC-type glycerol-3-phosphate transport system substrate-binding protein